MQFKHTILFAVVAFFTAVSCITVDKTLGDDLVSANQDLTVYTAELDVPVQMKTSSPVQAISGGEGVFGAIRTKEFGLVQFSTMADICPNMTSWDFGSNPVVKEVYFLAPVSSTYVVEDNQAGIPQQITLHRTYRRVDTTTVLSNSITPADYDPVPMNTSEFTFFGGDTIKINIDKSFGEEILRSTQEERDSLDLFVEKYKGLILKCSTPEDGTYGGRENTVTFGTGAVYIRVDYQPTWDEGLARKDTIFTLSWGYNYCVNVSEYESVNMENMVPGDDLLFEGCGGLKPFISHTALKETIDNWKQDMEFGDKKILVSKGAFIFPFEIPEDYDMTKYPSNLYPAHRVTDTSYNKKFFYPMADINVAGYNIGKQDRSLCQYYMDVPSTIQDFVSKDKSELDDTYDMWLMPTFASTDSYDNTTYSIDCTTYYTGKINGPLMERKPKLLLIYSVMED